MSDVKYMNVWRNRDGSHQWTDIGCYKDAINTREFVDAIAAKYSDGTDGIYRMAVLRIRPKGSHDSNH